MPDVPSSPSATIAENLSFFEDVPDVDALGAISTAALRTGSKARLSNGNIYRFDRKDSAGDVAGANGGRWHLLAATGVEVNVTTFGALGDGSTDNQAAFVAALDYCASLGASLYVPAGVYLHSNQLNVDGIRMSGDGAASELRATNVTNAAINVSGVGAVIENLGITCVAGSRQLTAASDGVAVRNATNFVIRNNTIAGSARMAVFHLASKVGLVRGNVVHDTNADGIHVGGGCERISIVENRVSNTGDDAIASVGTTTVNTQLDIHGNVLAGGHARAITVIGASHVDVFANCATHFRSAAAMAIGNDTTFGGLAASFVTVRGNTFEDCGSRFPHNAMFQLAASISQPLRGLTISDNRCTHAGAWFLQCVGAGFRDFRIENNTFDSNKADSAFEFCGLTHCEFSRNLLRKIASYAITANNSCGGVWKIAYNDFEDINTGNNPVVDCINVDDVRFEECSIHNNTLAQPGGSTVERYVEAFRSSGVSVFDNSGLPATRLGDAVSPAPH